MPLDTSSIVLNHVSFDPDFILSNPLKSMSTLLEVKNDEPQAILVKWEGSSKKLKARPSVAIIPSRTKMLFKLTQLALNLRTDSPRAYYTCEIVGVKDDGEGERHPSKKIWDEDALWKKLTTTHIHERSVFVEYTGMLKSGWWKTGDDGKARIMYGVVLPEEEEEEEEEEGGQEGSQESPKGSQEASEED